MNSPAFVCLSYREGHCIEESDVIPDNLVLIMIDMICRHHGLTMGGRVISPHVLESFLINKTKCTATTIVMLLESSEQPLIFVWGGSTARNASNGSGTWEITVARNIARTVWVQLRTSLYLPARGTMHKAAQVIRLAYKVHSLKCPNIMCLPQPTWVPQQLGGSDSSGLYAAGYVYLALADRLHEHYLTNVIIQRIRRFTIAGYLKTNLCGRKTCSTADHVQHVSPSSVTPASTVTQDTLSTPLARVSMPLPCTVFPLSAPFTQSVVEREMKNMLQMPPTEKVYMCMPFGERGTPYPLFPRHIQAVCNVQQVTRFVPKLGVDGMLPICWCHTLILTLTLTLTHTPRVFDSNGQRVEKGVSIHGDVVYAMINLLCKSRGIDTGQRVFTGIRLDSFIHKKWAGFATDIVTQLESSEAPCVYVWHTTDHWQITVAHKIGNTVWVRRRNSVRSVGKYILIQTVDMIRTAYKIKGVTCPCIESIEQPNWVTQQVTGSQSCGLHAAGNAYLAFDGTLDQYYLTHEMIQRIRRFTVAAYMINQRKQTSHVLNIV